MGRPKKLKPSIEKTICLDADLVAKVDLILFSELEGKVPFGAWQRFVTLAINNQLGNKGGKANGND